MFDLRYIFCFLHVQNACIYELGRTHSSQRYNIHSNWNEPIIYKYATFLLFLVFQKRYCVCCLDKKRKHWYYIIWWYLILPWIARSCDFVHILSICDAIRRNSTFSVRDHYWSQCLLIISWRFDTNVCRIRIETRWFFSKKNVIKRVTYKRWIFCSKITESKQYWDITPPMRT